MSEHIMCTGAIFSVDCLTETLHVRQ